MSEDMSLFLFTNVKLATPPKFITADLGLILLIRNLW